jgi:hypothetical protein
MVSSIHFLIPAHSRSGSGTNAQTGPKVREELYGETLGHDISELVSGGHMKDPDLSKRDLLADELNVELDVLRAPVVNRVGSHIDHADIVAIDNRSCSEGNVKFLKKMADPSALGDDMSNRTVLSLSAGPGHRGLGFEDHEIRLSSRKMQKPEVECRMSGQLAQSASE